MTAKAASNTPPSIKIKVVTICSLISISKGRVGAQAGNLLTNSEAAGDKLTQAERTAAAARSEWLA